MGLGFLVTLGAIKPFLATRRSNGDLSVKDVFAVNMEPLVFWRGHEVGCSLVPHRYMCVGQLRIFVPIAMRLECSSSICCSNRVATVDCRILDTTGPCTAMHTTARQAKILVEIPKEI